MTCSSQLRIPDSGARARIRQPAVPRLHAWPPPPSCGPLPAGLCPACAPNRARGAEVEGAGRGRRQHQRQHRRWCQHQRPQGQPWAGPAEQHGQRRGVCGASPSWGVGQSLPWGDSATALLQGWLEPKRSCWASMQQQPSSPSADATPARTPLRCPAPPWSRTAAAPAAAQVSPDGLRCQARSPSSWGGGRATVGAFAGKVYFEVGAGSQGQREKARDRGRQGEAEVVPGL